MRSTGVLNKSEAPISTHSNTVIFPQSQNVLGSCCTVTKKVYEDYTATAVKTQTYTHAIFQRDVTFVQEDNA